MTKILGLSGSLRKASFNSALLRAASNLTPSSAEIVIGSLDAVPLYNGDVEDETGLPDAVKTLQTQLAGADALLLVTPEYNSGIPGVFKNTLDWMSRGNGGALFKGKPTAVIGASPSGFGTVLSQGHWLPTLRALGTRPWYEGRLAVAHADQKFDAQGQLTDAKTRDALRDYLAGFVATL
jgi:NAD(P)H-dependent FMN reductase